MLRIADRKAELFLWHPVILQNEGVIIGGRVCIPFKFADVTEEQTRIDLSDIESIDPGEDYMEIVFGGENDGFFKVQIPNEFLKGLSAGAGST